MESVVLVIHLFLALAIIGLVLMQRSEGGGLGIGGNSGGGAGNFASARGTANFLTRMTAICAAAFFATSLILGILAGAHTKANKGILEALSETPATIEASEQAEEAVSGDDAGGEQAGETDTASDDNDLPSAPIAE